MFGPQRHENLAAALPLPPEGQVVDLGCGRGHTIAALARRLGHAGRLVGVDLEERERLDSLRGDDRMEIVAADLNDPLPFAETTFDAAVCHNTLELLSDHRAFLSEVARVLVPGGHLLLSHADFDTIVLSSPDVDLTRRLVHAHTDTTLKWMDRSEGTIGRRLRAIASRSPFELVRTLSWVGLHTDLAPGGAAETAIRCIAAAARRDAELAGRIDGWLADLEALAERGEFLYSINDYAVLLRKPAA